MHRIFQLKTFGYEEVSEYLWFPHLYLNALVKINKRSGRIENMYRFQEYGVRSTFLYSSICKCRNTLVLVPNNAHKIAFFDLRTEDVSYIEIEERFIKRGTPYFRNACEYNGKVYLFPSRAAGIIKIDIENKTIKYIDLLMWIDREDEVLFRQEYEKVGTTVYLPFAEKNYVLLLDLEMDSVVVKQIAIGNRLGFSTIKKIGEEFWLSAWENLELYRWNEKENFVEIINDFPKDIEKESYTFAYANFIDEVLVCFPQECNMILGFNTKKKEFEIIKKIVDREKGKLITFCGCLKENSINVLLSMEKNIMELKNINGSFELVPYIEFDEGYNNQVIEAYFFEERKSLFLEPYINVKTFLEIIKKENAIVMQRRKNVGEVIYRELKDG